MDEILVTLTPILGSLSVTLTIFQMLSENTNLNEFAKTVFSVVVFLTFVFAGWFIQYSHYKREKTKKTLEENNAHEKDGENDLDLV